VDQWHAFLKSLDRKPRRTIVFTVSVPQAEMCCSVFSRAMDGVEWVCGKTQKEKRRSILQRFKNGDTAVCVNAQVLTEGYDNPFVELISMARPTKSRSLYTQMIGRSTRTLPGVIDDLPAADLRRDAIARSAKPYCRVLDFVGNSGRHKLVTCLDILGGHVSEEVAEAAKKKALEDGTPKRVTVLLSNSELELEKQRRQERIDAAERKRLAEEQRRKRLLARADYTTQNVDPLNRTRAQGEKIVQSRKFVREGKEFSDGQKYIFQQAGYDHTKFNYAQGCSIIGTLMGPPSKKTAEVLKDHGYDTRGKKNWECRKIIQHLRKEGKLATA
jgi:superfamily II DNA or RNA helicase